MALNGSASAMVSPASPTAGALLNGDVEQVAQAQSAGVTCDANGCKYNNYMSGGLHAERHGQRVGRAAAT